MNDDGFVLTSCKQTLLLITLNRPPLRFRLLLFLCGLPPSARRQVFESYLRHLIADRILVGDSLFRLVNILFPIAGSEFRISTAS